MWFTDKGQSRFFKSKKVFKEHYLDHDEWNQVHYKDTVTICYICGTEFQTLKEHRAHIVACSESHQVHVHEEKISQQKTEEA